jgi:hypothetical protein
MSGARAKRSFRTGTKSLSGKDYEKDSNLSYVFYFLFGFLYLIEHYIMSLFFF